MLIAPKHTESSAHASRNDNEPFFKLRAQGKLIMNQPGDLQEVEADKAADQIVNRNQAVNEVSSSSDQVIQVQVDPKAPAKGKAAKNREDTKADPEKLEYDKWKKENEPKVTAVKSLAEKDAKAKLAIAKTELVVRIKKRSDDIDKEIKTIEEFLAPLKSKPKSYTDELLRLKTDKSKTKEQIYKIADSSKRVNPDRRTKIIKSMDTISATEKIIETAKTNWHKYDAQFTGSQDLMNVLKEIKIAPADLKALVGQESGDLMLGNDQEGNIAGIAQIGKKETKAVGNKEEDRLDDKKAVLIAAKVLRLNINAAGIGPSMMASIDDYKKMAFAAYNAGGNAIKQSRSATKTNTTWAGLIQGDTKSGLYLGLTKTYDSKKVSSKFKEVKNYVQRIYERLEK